LLSRCGGIHAERKGRTRQLILGGEREDGVNLAQEVLIPFRGRLSRTLREHLRKRDRRKLRLHQERRIIENLEREGVAWDPASRGRPRAAENSRP